MNEPLPDRLAHLPEAVVTRGNGDGANGQVSGCVVELWAWLRGLPWSDRPDCLHPDLAELLRYVNDTLADELRDSWAKKVAALPMPAGDEAGRLLDRLAARRLREELLPLAHTWPATAREVIEWVIAALESGERAQLVNARKHAWLQAAAGDGPAFFAAEAAALAAQGARKAPIPVLEAVIDALVAAAARPRLRSVVAEAVDATYEREAQRILQELEAL